METDINVYTETKRNGKWSKVEKGLRSDWYDENDDEYNTDEYKCGDEVFGGRNYSLFSYLADVRNRMAFGGGYTDEYIEPICEPKGLPKDVSALVQFKKEYCGGYSHSYLTLEELKDAYDKSKSITQVQMGYVDVEQFKVFKEKGGTNDWCSFVRGPDVERITNKEMESKVGAKEDGKAYFTQIKWKWPLSENVGGFFNHVIPQLEKLKESSDDVRIVFWFDN